MSKREEMRRQRKQQEQTQRIVVGVVILVGALLVAFALIYPNLQPVGEITLPEPFDRGQVNMNSVGDPNAPVKIDVWEDFQCPACARYSESVEKQIIEAYVKTGKVYYTFHHFPFLDDNSATKESDQAASASMCAGEQGKFWEYHDVIYLNWNGENQSAYNDRRLIAFAEALSLDMNAFNACFDEKRYMTQIEQDMEAGRTLGVTGTPSVFVNGLQIMPGYIPTFEAVAEAVEAALQK
jgi:protein-disulfide isomerase